ncbi:hypothetical protein Tco_0001278 [Tanacetum coccineum]
MACSIPHSDDEIQALVQKQIDEDMVHQKAILDLALQFDNACTTKEDLRKAYEKFFDLDDSDIPLVTRVFVLRSSSSAHVEPSSYTPNPVIIIPGPAGVVQLSNSICVEPSSSTPTLKVVEDVGEDADFNSGAWVNATNYVNAFGGTVTRCLGDIDNFLKTGKLEQVVAMWKSFLRCSWRFLKCDSERSIWGIDETIKQALNALNRWKLKEVFATCIILGGYLPLMMDNEGYQFSSEKEKEQAIVLRVSSRCSELCLINLSGRECEVREYNVEEEWMLMESESWQICALNLEVALTQVVNASRYVTYKVGQGPTLIKGLSLQIIDYSSNLMKAVSVAGIEHRTLIFVFSGEKRYYFCSSRALFTPFS